MAEEDVRKLVLIHGREKARLMVEPQRRSLVDIAAEVMADEKGAIGISYAGFCLTALPHKRLADDQAWEKRGHRVMLLIEPGRLRLGDKVKLWGVPYGARARMIMLYLQSQAVRTKSPDVELGRSMRAWMERMGLSVGGETARALREQSQRLSACTLKFFWEGEDSASWHRGAIVSSGLRFSVQNNPQGKLWEDRVVLDPAFFEALRKHPVPLRETAIRELRDRSMSLDLYVWLAYRLHTLERSTPITWAALHSQFGSGFKEIRHFRPAVTEALAAAVAAYPEARLEVEETGVLLHPSPPPVPRLSVAGGRG